MKPAVSPIHNYTIGEINADAGNTMEKNDFFVYRSEEMRRDEKMFRPSRSSIFIFILQLGGSVHVKLNLKEYSLKKNSLFIVSPGNVHEIMKIKDESNAYILGFTTDFLGINLTNKKYVDAFYFFSSQSNPLFLLTDTEAETLGKHMFLLKDLYANNGHLFKEEMMHHQFSLFMFELAATLSNYRQRDAIIISRKEELLIGFIKLLNTHIKEHRSVQFYAGCLFITSKHLTKVLKEITGKTCGEMIDEMVIIEAKILLNDANLSIAQVADMLNFSDQFFFSKFFKNLAGVNPTEFRKGA